MKVSPPPPPSRAPPPGIYRRSTGRDRPTDGVFRGVARDGSERVVRRAGGAASPRGGAPVAAQDAGAGPPPAPWAQRVVTPAAEFRERVAEEQAAWAAAAAAAAAQAQAAAAAAAAARAALAVPAAGSAGTLGIAAGQGAPQQPGAADASTAAAAAALAAALQLLQEHQRLQQAGGPDLVAAAGSAAQGTSAAAAWALPAALALLTGASPASPAPEQRVERAGARRRHVGEAAAGGADGHQGGARLP
jgi:hypothetical protein